MVSFTYLVRTLILVLLIFSLLAGGYSGYWDDILERWRDIRFATQMILVVLFGWPLIGFVTPVLIDLWTVIANRVAGLGEEFIITDFQTQLLFFIIAGLAVQTTIFSMRLKRIQEQL